MPPKKIAKIHPRNKIHKTKAATAEDGSDYLVSLFDDFWMRETKHLCRIETYRADSVPEATTRAGLRECRTYIAHLANAFNARYMKDNPLTSFQWCGSADEDGNVTGYDTDDQTTIDNNPYWVFGYRVGPDDAEYKLTLVCHLDTVPASSSDGWDPFDPIVKRKLYTVGTQPWQKFLVGRGCIDDKGPAMSAFCVVRALARFFDASDKFEKTQLEIIFDTSEETDMSTPQYWADPNSKNPDFGIVYDAMWCVRAEKGGERPVFWVSPGGVGDGLKIDSLVTSPNNSANTIPDWAKATITGSASDCDAFANEVADLFDNTVFEEDEGYNQGDLEVDYVAGSGVVTLLIEVAGAQHGSAPDENKAEGVNPLVSMANFLATLVDEKFVKNECASIVKFIRYTWGTNVFGEGNEEETLYKYDDVFVEGNGTTYAVTKTSVPTAESIGEEGDPAKIGGTQLEIDIRYAVDHHSNGWDHETEGYLPGDNSVFGQVFADVVSNFNAAHPNLLDVNYDGVKTLFAPDIRTPETNANYKKAVLAYCEVMQTTEGPPPLAIGGGTDAKGNTSVLALGPLFDTKMGPPINYHGISEGAPIVDFKKSTEILYKLCFLEISAPSANDLSPEVRAAKKGKMANIYKKNKALGRKMACNH